MDLFVAAFLFAVVWYTRYIYDRPGAATDLRLFILLWIVLPRSDPQQSITSWNWRSHFLLNGYCCLQCACCVGLAFLNVYLLPQLYRKLQEYKVDVQDLEARLKRLQWDFDNGRYTSQYDDSPLKPILFPCRTSHTRIFPQKHSFSYSYLFVGIPIGWRGWISSLLTADLKSLPWRSRKPKIGWFNVDSADYLARGDSVHGLRGKLDAYLESQNEKVEDYPNAYLVTAPRFLGYSFNPVSFWYLYDEGRKLKAMILEVNNTFDERRMYFLKSSEPDNAASGDETENASTNKTDQQSSDKQNVPAENAPKRFTNSWPKDFHVSPFNSRKGAYSLSADDPFIQLSNKAGAALINNTITLSSSKQHPKLIARVFSSSNSIDPYTLQGWGKLRFIAAWWWVGLVTFPRIVREAGKLFFRRKLHVWFRPEVLKDSIGRNETRGEKAVAAIFRDYLESLVESSDLSYPVQFLPGIATVPAQEIFKPHSLQDEPNSHQNSVTFKITSPLFYAQIARCTSVPEYIKVAVSKPDPQAAIFYTSHPDLLGKIFENPSSVNRIFTTKPSKAMSTDEDAGLPPADNLKSTSLLNRLRWLPIRLLRRLPFSSHHHLLSNLDSYALYLPPTDAPKVRAYKKAVLKMLLSDYVAFGIPAVIDVALWIIRIWLCWLCVQSFQALMGLWNETEHLTVRIGKIVMGCLGVHLWWGVGELL